MKTTKLKACCGDIKLAIKKEIFFDRGVDAKDLREGDVFLGANGELSTVVSNERVEFPEGITVYNFTVDGNHNYFVIAETDEFGQTCILVHNAQSYYGWWTDWQGWKDLWNNGGKGATQTIIGTALSGALAVGKMPFASALFTTYWTLYQANEAFEKLQKIEDLVTEAKALLAKMESPKQQLLQPPEWLQNQWNDLLNLWQHWQSGQLPTHQMMSQWVDVLQGCEQWWQQQEGGNKADWRLWLNDQWNRVNTWKPWFHWLP